MNTITIRTGRWLAVAVTTLLLLTACAGPATREVADGSTSSVPEAGEVSASNGDFPEPTPEGTGVTEKPQGPSGGVSVSLPGLPIGGDASVDPVDPTWRCAIVNWTGTDDPPPPEVNLTLTQLQVEPSSDYHVDAGGCAGLGTCLDRANVLSGGGRCAVGLRQIAFRADAEGALFVTAGSVACSPQDVAICAQFLAELDQIDRAQSIQWFDALTEPPQSHRSPATDGSSQSQGGSPDPGQPAQTEGGGDEDRSTSSP